MLSKQYQGGVFSPTVANDSFSQLASFILFLWRELPDEEKQKWEDLSLEYSSSSSDSKREIMSTSDTKLKFMEKFGIREIG